MKISLPRSLLVCALAATVAAVWTRQVSSAEVDLEKAAAEFKKYCSSCHGRDAMGSGPAARQLKVEPADLTKISKKAGGVFPMRAVFEKIEGLTMPDAHGTKGMPIWADRFVREELGDGVELNDAARAAREANERIERLVAYLETIQK